jgi:hypothetical protein
LGRGFETQTADASKTAEKNGQEAVDEIAAVAASEGIDG